MADLLNRKSIENYCPLNKVKKQWHDRKKVIHVPLFTSYVFVKADSINRNEVLETDGVLNFVHWLHKPAVIRDIEIQTIKDFLVEYDHIQLEKTRISINDQIRITEGPLVDLYGKVLSISGKTIWVELPSLGYALKVQVLNQSVEKVIENAFRPKAGLTQKITA